MRRNGGSARACNIKSYRCCALLANFARLIRSPICRYVDTCSSIGRDVGNPGVPGELHLQLTAQIYICRVPACEMFALIINFCQYRPLRYSCSPLSRTIARDCAAFWRSRVACGSWTGRARAPSSMIREPGRIHSDWSRDRCGHNYSFFMRRFYLTRRVRRSCARIINPRNDRSIVIIISRGIPPDWPL